MDTKRKNNTKDLPGFLLQVVAIVVTFVIFLSQIKEWAEYNNTPLGLPWILHVPLVVAAFVINIIFVIIISLVSAVSSLSQLK